MKSAGHNPGTDIYLPLPAVITGKRELTALETLYELKLDSGRPLGQRAGQFVAVSIAGMGEAPISVSSAPSGDCQFELVVRRAGVLTNALHRLGVGDRVGIRGPFGTCFPVDTVMLGKDLLFVCGGIGLAPVRPAIEQVLGRRGDYGAITIICGAKTPADRIFPADIARWRKSPRVTVIDTVDSAAAGWNGQTGLVTNFIPPLALAPARTAAIICGPPIMYKFVIIELYKKEIPERMIYLSLERHMKCGVGKCGHCQVNHLYMCQDGPVVCFADIRGLAGAI